jgi:hypothetical protein
MNTLRTFLFLLSVVACVIAPVLRAQTPPPEEPKPANLRFLFLDENPGAYAIKSSTGLRPISSAPYAISQPVIVQPKTRFEIYQTLPVTDPVTGKKKSIKLGVIAPPAGIVSALVVVKVISAPPDSGESPHCDLTYFDTSIEAFPAGSIRAINLGRASLGIQFDKTAALQLQPGETRIVSPTPDSKNRVVVKIAVSEGDAWKLLSNKIAILKPGQRMTGVFVYSPSGLLHTYTAEELAEFGKPKPGHFWLTYTDTP